MLSSKRRLLTPVAFAAALSFVASPRLPAQTSGDAPPSLAVALKSLPANYPLGASLLLTVAPENVKPLSDQEFSAQLGSGNASVPGSLGDVDPIESLGARFDRSYVIFGHVAAFGPRTMTVLGMPSDIKNDASSVPLSDAIQMLMGTFTEDQWRALGADGLSIDDLDDDQRRFWNDVVCRPMSVIPANLTFPGDNADSTNKAYAAACKLITADDVRSTSRLHAFLTDTATIYVGQKILGIAMNEGDAPPSVIHYRISIQDQPSPGPGPLDNVRADVVNQLKPSDLDWNSNSFKTTVDLRSAKTVADVVKVIAAATGVELHADRHYADRTVMLVGGSLEHVEIDDLLPAVDFALSATWRKVGPAYVLTDDQQGMGARKHWIRAAVDPVNKHNEDQMDDVESGLGKMPLYEYVGFLDGDTLSIPRGVIEKAVLARTNSGVLLGDLPPLTQQTIKGKIDDFVGKSWSPGSYMSPTKLSIAEAFAADHAINGQTHVRVHLNLHLYADMPVLGTLALDNGFSSIGYRPKPATGEQQPPVAKVNFGSHAVGVIAAPQSGTEAVKLVDKMANAGMRTLFCESFDGGETYFHSTVLPSMKAAHADVLTAAIAEGRKCHVAVYAVLHLMRWRNGVERVGDRDLKNLATEDMIVTGQTANQALVDAYRPKADLLSDNQYVADAGVWMEPSDPRVGDILTRLTAEVAAIPGIAGILLTDAAAPGYDGYLDGWYAGGIDFGYTPDMRLAFLRKHEQDPIDIDSATMAFLKLGTYRATTNDIDLRVASYQPSTDWADNNVDNDAWTAYRKSINDVVLKRVYESGKGERMLKSCLWRDLRLTDWKGPLLNVPDGVAPIPAFVIWPYRSLETSDNPLWVDLDFRIKHMEVDTGNCPILFDFSLTPAVTDPVAAVGYIANLTQIAKPGP